MNIKYKAEEERRQAKKEQDRRYYLKNKDKRIKYSSDYYYTHKPVIEDLDGEEWKPLIGWEDLYEASNHGRIKSSWHNTIINGCYDKDGYRKITLTNKDGEQTTYRKCRLVAMTWIPNPDNKPEIDHINTIRDDDRVVNLRWCTSKENKSNPNTIENKKLVDYGFNRGKHKNEEGRMVS